MSFKVKRWGSLGQINVTDYYPGAHPGLGGAQVRAYVFSFAGRIVFLCYEGASGVNAPIYFTYDPATESWTGPHDGSAVQGGNWSYYSDFYGNSAAYLTWGFKYIVGYGMNTSQWAGGPTFVTFDAGFSLTAWGPPAGPSGAGIDNVQAHYHVGIGTDPAGEPARHMTYTYVDWNAGGVTKCIIYRYGPGGSTMVWQGLFDDLAWTEDSVDHEPYFASNPAGSMIFWPVNSGCADARVEDSQNLFASPPLVGSECSPLAPIAIAPGYNHIPIDGITWGVVTDRTAGNPGVERWAPVSEDASSAASPPWSGTWDMRRQRDGLGYAIDQGDLDGIDHAADVPIVGEPSYNSGLGWYVGRGDTSTIQCDLYVLDPWQPAGMAARPARAGIDAIGWIGECAIRANLRVEDVLPAGRASPAGLGGSVVERKSGKYLLTPSAIVKRSGGALTVGPPLSVDVSSYPVTGPDWLWPGSEDGRVENFWASFAEGPGDTMLWGGMPDATWGMYIDLGGWVPRWMGLGTLHDENLEAAGGLPTHVLESSSGVVATYTDMQPLPANYESAPEQLVGWPDFPGGPVVAYFASCAQQSQPPFWRALVWRVLNGVWTELVDFNALGSPGLGELDWTVWSVAPIRACRALPQGGFLVGATLYFTGWVDDDPAGWPEPTTFMDTGLGYVPGKPGNEGPIPKEHVPIQLAAEPYSGGRSLYGPDALLVYDHTGAFVTHLNTADVYPPDGRQILVTREANPRVIYKCYREGTYSDFAEGWGAYHRFAADAETQTGLYVCYDLINARGQIAPGLGSCHGFLDMYALGAAQDATWRWSVGAGLYDALHPRDWWSPPGRSQLRMGLGGLMITPLAGGPASTRNGVRGVGSRG